MGKLKKITTVNFLKLDLFRDDEGQRFYRRGGRDSRIKRVPRWVPGKRSMRWIGFLAVLAIIGIMAYSPVMKYASDKVVEKVADQLFTSEELEDILQDPSIQKIMEQLERSTSKSPLGDGSFVDQGTPVVTEPVLGKAPVLTTDSIKGSDMAVEDMSFSTNEDAMKFLLKKFEMNELKSLADKAKDGLTREEKSEIKSILTERLTQTEYDSLKIIAAMEIKRRQDNLIVEP